MKGIRTVKSSAIWLELPFLLGIFLTFAGADSEVELVNEWPLVWNTDAWKMDIKCTVDVPTSYAPTTATNAFYIKLILENHATSPVTVYWPFDATAVTVEDVGDNKEFSVPTLAGQWIFSGQHIFSFQVEFVNAELNVFGNWPRGSCSGPFPIVSTITIPPAAPGDLRLITEWCVQGTLWRVNMECTVDVSGDYTPITPPRGFHIKLTLEGHATGDIETYWPFNDPAVQVIDLGGQKEFDLPTQDDIYIAAGEYVYNFLVDFTNVAQDFGHWPRGSCSGPLPLGSTGTTSTTAKSTTTTPSPPATTTTTAAQTTSNSGTTTTASSNESTTTPPLHNVDICANTVSHTGPGYNYEEVLCKSILFYEAQRSGDLNEATNRVPWRKDSTLGDGSDVGLDLSGGWFDAGDYVKFNFPMASATTLLSWGLIEWPGSYVISGQYDYFLDSVKWPLDYLLKCWRNTQQTLYAQVGDAYADHEYMGRPEDMNIPRPSFGVTATNPGTDLAAATAAAFAAGAIVFSENDPVYSKTLLDNAVELFDFAYNNNKGLYHGVVTNAAVFYRSWDYWDDLAWGAAWLYAATNDQTYLDLAIQISNAHGVNPEYAWSFDWDGKAVGVGLLLFEHTGDAGIQTQLQNFFSKWMNGQMGEDHQITPGGLVWRAKWGVLRHAANVAFAALMAAELGVWNTAEAENIRMWAKGQIDYMLGDNPNGRSYVVGFGNNPPTQPHHRASTCKPAPAPCDLARFNDTSRNNYYILYGALIGGPDENDIFFDNRPDWITNEVACDYNAGFQSALAGIINWRAA